MQRASSRLNNGAVKDNDAQTTETQESQYQSLPDANISTQNGDKKSEFVTKYKGFNTSITHILHKPESSRSDCCSIACCGLLQSDYNRYILHNRRPPTFRNRLIQYILIPLAFFCFAGYVSVSNIDANVKELFTWMFATMTVAWIFGGCLRSTYKHGIVRRDLLRKVHGMSRGIVVDSWDEV